MKIKVRYKNNEDGRTEISYFNNEEELISHIIETLNIFTGAENKEEYPEGWTEIEDIKTNNNGVVFYSQKWGRHHTWTKIKGVK